MTHRRATSSGFTLAEALLSAVLLTTVVSGITIPFTVATRGQQDDGRATVALNLAQEMMEEVISKTFADPNGNFPTGKDPGEVRATFDNITDYNNYIEAAGQIASADGTLLGGSIAKDLSRKTYAVYVPDAANPVFIRVTVEVYDRNQLAARVVRLVYLR